MGTVHVVRVRIKPQSSDELELTPARVQVNPSGNPIVIVWKLDEDELEFGLVNSDDTKDPGFAWRNPQSATDFSGPWFSADGKRIILDDSNTAAHNPEVEHAYELRAYNTGSKLQYKSRYVEFKNEKDPRTTTNPAIINK